MFFENSYLVPLTFILSNYISNYILIVNKTSHVNAPSIFLAKIESEFFGRNNCRGSRPKVFYEKGILKNFAKFTGNTWAEISLLLELHVHGLYQLQATSDRFHYCWLWTYFTHCSSGSIVDFEQVHGDWVKATKKKTMIISARSINLHKY